MRAVSSPRNPVIEGPVLKAVLAVALPAVGFQILIFLNNFVDYYWIQKLGSDAAAGQTAGWTLFWMLGSIGQIFSTGTTAIVARRIGERRGEQAVHAATHSLRGAILAAVLVGVAGWMLVPLVAAHNASSAAAGRYTVDYLRTIYAGAPIIFSFYALEGAFKGHGDMGRPLRALATALLVNMVLDPLLIFWAGLEVKGAALATVIAFGVTGGLLGRAALRRAWVRLFGVGLDLDVVRRVVRIGTPISLHGIIFSLVYVFIIREVNLASGDAGTAALGLGLRIEGFGFLIGVGFASAAAAVVGQNLGARQVRRAHAGAWTAARLAMYATGVCGLGMLLMPERIVAFMSPDRITTLHALDYLHIVAVSLPFTAVEIALQGGFSGAGDTLPPLLLGLPMTLIRIPAAIVAARVLGLGFPGIAWALTITSVIRGLMFAFWFARGRWVHAKA